MKIIALLLLIGAIAASAQTRDYAKTPPDKPVRAEDAQVNKLERAIQPYVAKARRTYPAARKRFLAGLPSKYIFSLTTKLYDRSHIKSEVVFVAVDTIKGGTVNGHLVTHTRLDIGYQFRDPISFPESKVMDWTIVHPDGTEEGNIVGKFLDTYNSR
jgi:hypothetical protein